MVDRVKNLESSVRYLLNKRDTTHRISKKEELKPTYASLIEIDDILSSGVTTSWTACSFDSVLSKNINAETDKITILSSGVYLVNLGISVQTFGVTEYFGIFVNGSLLNELYTVVNNSTSGAVTHVALCGCLKLKSGDYLELKIKADSATNMVGGGGSWNIQRVE